MCMTIEDESMASESEDEQENDPYDLIIQLLLDEIIFDESIEVKFV